jgi:hypothetical protein
MIVNLNEKALEDLLLEVLPNIGYEENNEDVPKGLIEFMKYLKEIPEYFKISMSAQGYVLGSEDYWVDVSNQINLSSAGRCDILISMYSHIWYDPNNPKDTQTYKKCFVIELKKEAISPDTIEQVLRYKNYIDNLKYYNDVEAILIGTRSKDIEHILSYLSTPVSLWMCEYNHDGMFLKERKVNAPTFPNYEWHRRSFVNSIYRNAIKKGDSDYKTLEEFCRVDRIFDELLNGETNG